MLQGHQRGHKPQEYQNANLQVELLKNSAKKAWESSGIYCIYQRHRFLHAKQICKQSFKVSF